MAARMDAAPRAQAVEAEEASLRKIIVGIDGTAAGWLAMEWAESDFALQAGHDDRVLVICHLDPPDSEAPVLQPTRDMASIERVDPTLAKIVAATRARRRARRVMGAAIRGESASILVGMGGPRDTIVVAAHGDAASLATAVAAHAAGPVVAVKPQPRGATRAEPFAGHVLVGVDDPISAGPAVLFAFEYAARHSLPVAAIHAAEPEPGGVWVDDTYLETHLVSHAPGLDILESAVREAHLAHPEVKVRRIALTGGAAGELTRASLGASLIVVGDRRRRPVARRLLGSVSRHLVRRAHCTVAVVHGSGKANDG